MTPMNRKAGGNIAEQLAAEHLEREGFVILERNRKCAGVETDIIAADGGELVFAEVKSSTFFGVRPAEHVGAEQMRRYVRAAKAYIAEKGLFGVNVRFDVIEVTDGRVRHIKGAFDADTAR